RSRPRFRLVPRGCEWTRRRGTSRRRSHRGGIRPPRDGPRGGGPRGPLSVAHAPRRGGIRVSHFGTLLLKEEKAVFSSPIAYATVAVYLLLMGYTFTAVLFLSRTGELVRVFFQAAVLLLLIVPVVTMRLFAEERRAGTLELLLTSPIREFEIVLAK